MSSFRISFRPLFIHLALALLGQFRAHNSHYHLSSDGAVLIFHIHTRPIKLMSISKKWTDKERV